MSDQLYRKVGRRYEPYGGFLAGDPAEGIWIVTRKPGVRSARLVSKIAELPDTTRLIELDLLYRDSLGPAVWRAMDRMMRSGEPLSADGIATGAIKELAENVRPLSAPDSRPLMTTNGIIRGTPVIVDTAPVTVEVDPNKIDSSLPEASSQGSKSFSWDAFYFGAFAGAAAAYAYLLVIFSLGAKA